MNFSYYKYCMVPLCKSTSVKTPNKLFIYVPHDPQIRKKWLTLARRKNVNCLSTNSRMYFCEDHFDLPNDMLNYTEYHIMGTVSKVITKPDCIPSKFECQEDRRKRACSSMERAYILKKQRMSIIAECLKESEKSCMPILSLKDTHKNFQRVEQKEPENSCPQKINKSVQACLRHKFRSKAVQTNVKTIDKALSLLKPNIISSSTSSFKTENFIKSCPSVSYLCKVSRNIFIEEGQDSDVSLYTPSVATDVQSPPVYILQVKSSDCSELNAEDLKLESHQTLLNTIKKIEKKPHLYIGVPKSSYSLIHILIDEMNIPKHHLLLCLNKIRLDTKFKLMADDYGMTPSSLSKIIFENVPLIASFMRPFIVELKTDMTKQFLPSAFRHQYYNVSCIIHCLEIEIQKPPTAINQAMTWSDYKKANTIKYLISCTPNGLVNYISPGFGGRITDTCIVESCDFIQTLKSGMVVMANKGFKNVEQLLVKSNIKLIRLPSAETGVKITKTKETKQMASLRIHVERVIRRLHEFYMLRPHACMNFKYVKIIDDIIIIVCALNNLQDSSIK